MGAEEAADRKRRLAMTTEERFWSKVDRRGPDECWRWLAGAVGGYGQFRNGKERIMATRYMLRLVGREPSPGLLVLHRCDHPWCVNPDHLFAGTAADNAHDMIAKGRQQGGPNHWHPRRP